jgi:NifU-like protein involved in Fe-S cluster formation
VTVDVKLDNEGKVTDFAHEVKACALGQASSSVMARTVIDTTLEEIADVRGKMLAMLKENAEPPDGRWADLAMLQPVRDFKARHASTMLTFDATVEAIETALAKQRETVG